MKPVVYTMSDGEKHTIITTPAQYAKVHESYFRYVLGRFHVGHSYREAFDAVFEPGSKPRANLRCLPVRYRKALALKLIRIWWEFKDEYNQVMWHRRAIKPACLIKRSAA